MSAKDMFYELGYKYYEERTWGIEFKTGYGLDSRHIDIDKEGRVLAWEESDYEEDSTFEMSFDIVKAVVAQLREFGLKV